MIIKKGFIFMAVCLCLLAGTIPSSARDNTEVDIYDRETKLIKSVVFKIGVPYYVVNGQTPGIKMDVAPFIKNDRTFVPVRFLGNALGLDDSRINWDNSAQAAALKGNATLQMTIGQASITSNGVTKKIDVAPVLQSGRTFLPARYVAEGLGFEVGWDDSTQTVVCWPKGNPQPDVSSSVNFLSEQVAKEPVVGTIANGYKIPAGTKLDVFPSEADDPKGYIVFAIEPKAGNLEQQYRDAEYILSQTIDPKTVAEVIAYAKAIQEPILAEEPWGGLGKHNYLSPNGMEVRVNRGNGYSIQFDVQNMNLNQ
ncbi:MAG: copper amine oxidase N-terminal domain-containing protein [Bacillota bacterium]